MANNMKQQLNEILLKIDAAALAKDFTLVEALVSECRSVMRETVGEEFTTIRNSLTEIMKVVEEEKLMEPVTSNYRADRPKTGQMGRPSVDITKNQLDGFRAANYTVTEMGKQLGCSAKTVSRRLKAEGLDHRYTEITDEDLDNQIEDLKSSFPNAGSQMMQGFLEARNIRVKRQRVRDSLRRTDAEGSRERWRSAVHRRQYKVPTPNALWHMDGHMKLIRWGFNTHGCIDGFSRLIVFLRCNTNNTSSTVLSLFVEACSSYGVPAKVRSDHGGENTKVALFLNLVRQSESHITGQSTHNQRIERMWRDMHTQVTSNFYRRFYDMEDNPAVNLDPDNVCHRQALHHIFLPIINQQLEEFRKGWNNHRIRTESHSSPYQLWISGMLGRMYSGHTATRELFGETQTVQERLENGLERFGLSVADLGEDGLDERNDGMAENLLEEIDAAVENLPTYEEKFVKCVEILQSHQSSE